MYSLKKKDLLKCLEYEWNKLDLEIIRNYVRSIPKQCSKFKRTRGSHTLYWDKINRMWNHGLILFHAEYLVLFSIRMRHTHNLPHEKKLEMREHRKNWLIATILTGDFLLHISFGLTKWSYFYFDQCEYCSMTILWPKNITRWNGELSVDKSE